MVKIRARLSLQEVDGRLRVKVRPVHPVLFGALALLLLAGFLIAGVPAKAFGPANLAASLFYLLLMLFIAGAAGFSRVSVADTARGRFSRFLSLFGLVLPFGRFDRSLNELREVILERIVLVNPRVAKEQAQWEHESLRKTAALHRFSLQFPGRRVVIADSTDPDDLESAAAYMAGFVGVPLDRRER
jgi:hypothetical protein